MKEERNQHPGWAVRFEDGTWMAYAHGFHQMEDAFYARLYESKQVATDDVLEALSDWKRHINYEIVEGWQPLCEQLRLEILSLKKANTLDPDAIFDIVNELEFVLNKLKKGSI